LGQVPQIGPWGIGLAACASPVERCGETVLGTLLVFFGFRECGREGGETVLRLLVFVGFQPAAKVQPQLAESATQGLPPDPQPTGGLKLIPARILQDAAQ
jgi:hypothetical protein